MITTLKKQRQFSQLIKRLNIMSRQYTNLLIESAEEGYTSKEALFDSLMSYLSEDQVKEFCLESEARETAWMLAEKIGNQGADFTNHEELKSEWDYLNES